MAEPQPFHATTLGIAERPALLLISYHFPPGTEVGGLRWAKLVHHVEGEFEFDVVTAEPESLDRTDWNPVSALPAGMRLFGVEDRPSPMRRIEDLVARGLRRLRRLGRSEGGEGTGGSASRPESFTPEQASRWPRSVRDFARMYWFFLEFREQVTWARKAAELSARIYDPKRHRAVVTSGPPHFTHEAGRRIAARTGLPWVMDMRDPWSLPHRVPEIYATPLFSWMSQRYERRAVEKAKLVVVNSEPVEQAMGRVHPEVRSRLLTVTNGFDDPVPGPDEPPTRFDVIYAGTIYLDRDPRPLFAAARILIEELALWPGDFRIRLVGNVRTYNGVPTEELAASAGIEDFVDILRPVPRGEVQALLREASVLVSLPQDNPWAIPAKLFEYMEFNAWLLVFAEPNCPTGMLLRGTAADVVVPGDVAATAEVLRKRYLAHAAGELPSHDRWEDRFSRRYQSERLFEAVRGVLNSPSELSSERVAASSSARTR